MADRPARSIRAAESTLYASDAAPMDRRGWMHLRVPKAGTVTLQAVMPNGDVETLGTIDTTTELSKVAKLRILARVTAASIEPEPIAIER